jgi:hypothetical protein
VTTKRNVFWPNVSTLEDAAWATKQGVWAAGFVAAATGIVALAALSLHKQVAGLGGSALLDAAIFVAVAYGIHKNSRFAAVSGLVIYLAERTYMLKVGQAQGAGATVMVVFLALAFITAVRGTFAHRRLTTEPTARTGTAPSLTPQ